MSARLRGAGIRRFGKDDILSGLLGALAHCRSSTAVACATVSEEMSIFEVPICLQLLSSFNWRNPVG